MIFFLGFVKSHKQLGLTSNSSALLLRMTRDYSFSVNLWQFLSINFFQETRKPDSWKWNTLFIQQTFLTFTYFLTYWIYTTTQLNDVTLSSTATHSLSSSCHHLFRKVPCTSLFALLSQKGLFTPLSCMQECTHKSSNNLSVTLQQFLPSFQVRRRTKDILGDKCIPADNNVQLEYKPQICLLLQYMCFCISQSYILRQKKKDAKCQLGCKFRRSKFSQSRKALESYAGIQISRP